MQVTIGREKFLQVILCDIIVKVLDQDGSATLRESFETRGATKSLLGLHERFLFKPTASKARVASTVSAALATTAPSAVVILHFFILVPVKVALVLLNTLFDKL